MAAGNRVVDISEDAVTVRRRRRRALLRIGVPILGIVLVIAAIIGIALYSHEANRRGVLALSDDLLNNLDAQISQRVSAFLDPCERVLRILRDVAVRTPPTERRATTERFAGSVLAELPQMAAFYAGDSDGNFMMARRGENFGVSIKQIYNDDSGRNVLLIERNAAGIEIGRREDPADTFDPRTRPWFQGALTAADVYWTGIYIFFSDGKPGITVSTKVREPGGVDRVFGVDITLEELSRFLGTLEIGSHGRALIMDEEGRLIAVPHSEDVIKPTGDQFIPPKVDELGDDVLTAAFDRFRVEGEGRRIIEHDDVSYISSVTPLPGSGRHWYVMIVVPEEDFIGFVASNNRTALAMSMVIVLAVMALAALLVRQGVRADRSVRLMTERGRNMSQQNAVYAAVSEQIAEGGRETPPALTEGLITVTGARRASVWRLTANNQILHCPDSYERDGQGHAGGFELHRRELPAFFDLLEKGDELTMQNAAADKRTAQFHSLIMDSLGSRALTIVPLMRGEQPIGAICLEDPESLDGVKEFLRTLAAMLAATLQVAAPDRPAQAAPAKSRVTPADQVGCPILPADLGSSRPALSAADRADLSAQHLPDIAALVLRLSGPLALAKKAGDGEAGLAAQIAELLQEVFAEHGVTYLKLVGQEAIAAAGLEQDEDAMTRIAEAAIVIRDRLSLLTDLAGAGAEFRIGLGFGSAFGCLIGRELQQFNLWGEAIETAEIMARSAAPGAIQASAGAYARLRQDFLFRPRGSFYLPGVGQSRTFVLAGQL
jgi:class 3 adenylate cyclase